MRLSTVYALYLKLPRVYLSLATIIPCGFVINVILAIRIGKGVRYDQSCLGFDPPKELAYYG